MLFVFKTFASFFLLLGLLKFGLDAPNLIKTIIGGADDLLKGKFNGFANFGSIGEDVKKGFGAVNKYGIKPVGTMVKGTSKVAGGAVGGVTGAVSGAKEHGFVGGVRGMVAGGKTGFDIGLKKGFADASSYAGTQYGRYGKTQRKNMEDAASSYNATYDLMQSSNAGLKAKVDKEKEAKKASDSACRNNIDTYVLNMTNDATEKANRESRVNSRLSSEGLSRTNRNDAARIHEIEQEELSNDQERYRTSVTKAFEDQRDREKDAADYNISKYEGQMASQDLKTTSIEIDKFNNSRSSWGRELEEEYTAEFDKKLEGIKNNLIVDDVNAAMRDVTSNAGKTFAGSGAQHITDSEIKKLIVSIDGLKKQEARGTISTVDADRLRQQEVALGQIMKSMNNSSKALSDKLKRQERSLEMQTNEAKDKGKNKK